MKISIITATFNSEATIRDTLESILKQSHTDFELIVKDGGSKDKTLAICEEYLPAFNGRLNIISCPDKGIYDAMNQGIKAATGDVVGILNSDDFYHRTDVLEKVNDAFKNTEIQAVYGDVRFVNNDNLEKTVRYYSSKMFSPKLFRFGFMPAHPTFFTYKRYFDEFGYYQTDYKIAADYELLIRFLYTHRLNAQYIPLDFLKMRMGGASTASWKSNIILNQEIVRGCKENGIWTCMPLLFLKYFVKVFELLFTKR